MATFRKPANMTAMELEEFRESFDTFDVDQNGQITTEELGAVMRSMGRNPSDAVVRKMIEELDTDKSGTVDFSEFLAMYAEQKADSEAEEGEIRAAFKAFDRDGDGFITASELRHVMSCMGESLTESEVNKMIKAADMDGNGKIDYMEFSKVLMKRK